MIRAVETLLRALPADAVARRALDETFADWRHELADSAAPASRLQAHLRGGVAVAGVLTRTTLAEVGGRDSWRLATRVVLLAALCSAANISMVEARFVAPQILPEMFPEFALLLCAVIAARGDARRLWLGAAAIVGGLLFLYSGWLAPSLQHLQNERIRAFIGVRLTEPDLWELPLPALARIAWQAGWDSGLAVIRVNAIVAMAVMAPCFVWLGLSVRRLCEAVHRPRFARLLALACAVSVFALGDVLMRFAVPLGDGSTFARAAVEVATFWSHVAVALLEGALLIWLARPRTRARIRAWRRARAAIV